MTLRTNLYNINKLITVHPRVKEQIKNMPLGTSNISAINQVEKDAARRPLKGVKVAECAVIENLKFNAKGDATLIIRLAKRAQTGFESHISHIKVGAEKQFSHITQELPKLIGKAAQKVL